MMKHKCKINPSNLSVFFAHFVILGAAISSPIFPGAMALSYARSLLFRRGCAITVGTTGSRRGIKARLRIEDSAQKTTSRNLQPYHPLASPVVLLSADYSSSSTEVEFSGDNTKMNNASKDGKEGKDWSNYEKLVRKLYMTNLFNPVKLGLDNMHKLHEYFGSPMDQANIAVVHIAGSNGKGSVALKTANTLQLANYRVGLFVSPHISSFRERIQINGMPISECLVEKYLQEVFDVCETQNIPATFFEVTTALAFHVFAQEKVDVVVLETGLGGRLDATNVIKHPVVSVITSIGLEHTRILGDTVEKIALEKGGIIKEGCPVVVGKNVPTEVLRECAKGKKASGFYECADLLGPEEEPTFFGGSKMLEDYDAENSRITRAALTLIRKKLSGKSSDDRQMKYLSNDVIDKGVKIRPPCRFEEFEIPTTIIEDDGSAKQTKVKVILDVAHNPQAMDYLIAKLISNYPTSKQRIVVGMSADKDLKYCTEILLDHVSHPQQLHLVEASHPRAASIESILGANPTLVESHYEKQQNPNYLNPDGRDVSSVATQVRKALELAAKNDELLVVCGSVFIMADAREELGIIEPRDSDVIAEVAGAGMRNSQENFSDEKKS